MFLIPYGLLKDNIQRFEETMETVNDLQSIHSRLQSESAGNVKTQGLDFGCSILFYFAFWAFMSMCNLSAAFSLVVDDSQHGGVWGAILLPNCIGQLIY